MNRTRWLHIRVTDAEHRTIINAQKQTASRNLSEYARKKILDKPIIMYTRSRSADELMAAVILVRNQLSAIGNNYNQVVKKLHTLKHENEISTWLMIHEKTKETLIKKIEESRKSITALFEKWSPSSKEVQTSPGHSTTMSTNAGRAGQRSSTHQDLSKTPQK